MARSPVKGTTTASATRRPLSGRSQCNLSSMPAVPRIAVKRKGPARLPVRQVARYGRAKTGVPISSDRRNSDDIRHGCSVVRREASGAASSGGTSLVHCCDVRVWRSLVVASDHHGPECRHTHVAQVRPARPLGNIRCVRSSVESQGDLPASQRRAQSRPGDILGAVKPFVTRTEGIRHLRRAGGGQSEDRGTRATAR